MSSVLISPRARSPACSFHFFQLPQCPLRVSPARSCAPTRRAFAAYRGEPLLRHRANELRQLAQAVQRHADLLPRRQNPPPRRSSQQSPAVRPRGMSTACAGCSAGRTRRTGQSARQGCRRPRRCRTRPEIVSGSFSGAISPWYSMRVESLPAQFVPYNCHSSGTLPISFRYPLLSAARLPAIATMRLFSRTGISPSDRQSNASIRIIGHVTPTVRR